MPYMRLSAVLVVACCSLMFTGCGVLGGASLCELTFYEHVSGVYTGTATVRTTVDGQTFTQDGIAYSEDFSMNFGESMLAGLNATTCPSEDDICMTAGMSYVATCGGVRMTLRITSVRDSASELSVGYEVDLSDTASSTRIRGTLTMKINDNGTISYEVNDNAAVSLGELRSEASSRTTAILRPAGM